MIQSQVTGEHPLRKRLPPATSLITFESAARLGSFTAAADELRVTQAAVSRQIRRIEDFVGAPLFVAAGRGRTLSPAGRQLLEAATQGLEHIAKSIAQVKAYGTRQPLALSAPLSFVNLWLMPRLGAFREAYPDIDLHFATGDIDMAPPDAANTIAIRFGDGKWPHLSVHPLLDMQVVPVCSPAYAAAFARRAAGHDEAFALLGGTLLDRDTEPPLAIRWDAWFTHAGIPGAHAPRRLLFSSYDAVLHAALHGQGIALGADALLRGAFRRGELVRATPEVPGWPLRCHLVMPGALQTTPEMQQFIAWITNEAGRPIERL
ncbi:MAG: LysR substrate-binding domain-containing protein [Burkholderia gladioli]